VSSKSSKPLDCKTHLLQAPLPMAMAQASAHPPLDDTAAMALALDDATAAETTKTLDDDALELVLEVLAPRARRLAQGDGDVAAGGATEQEEAGDDAQHGWCRNGLPATDPGSLVSRRYRRMRAPLHSYGLPATDPGGLVSTPISTNGQPRRACYSLTSAEV